ncbi:hypothetical protein BG004_000592 [Podila humilis]|nr:hypothetical protein BG004_000592 [Podila humilis]
MSHLDPLAEHSASLCDQFNQSPSLVLDLARSLGGDNSIVSAQVSQVTQTGFLIVTQDRTGRQSQTKVTSSRSMHSISHAHEVFTALATQSACSKIQKVPRQPPGWRTYWPNWNTFLVSLAVGVTSFFYIYFFPETRIPIFQWTIRTVGMPIIRNCVHFAIGLHSFQTATAWYLMRRVSAYRFTLPQGLVWTGCVQLFGIGSMLKLLPIVYNSAWVHAQNQQELHEGYPEVARITSFEE